MFVSHYLFSLLVKTILLCIGKKQQIYRLTLKTLIIQIKEKRLHVCLYVTQGGRRFRPPPAPSAWAPGARGGSGGWGGGGHGYGGTPAARPAAERGCVRPSPGGRRAAGAHVHGHHTRLQGTGGEVC